MVIYKLLTRFPLLYELTFTLYHFPTLKNRFSVIHPYLLPGKTLEIGCGTGKSSEVLLSKNPNMVHLDINRRYLQLARTKNIKNIVLGNGCCLPFKSNSLDQVVLVDAFHHIFNLDMLFQEVHRALKKKGRFIVLDPVHTRPVENAWGCDIVDGPIWKHTVEMFRKKVQSLSEKRFKEIVFMKSQKLSTINAVSGTTDVVYALEKL